MTTRTLTTANGIPVADNQNSLTAGARGPIVFEDVHLFEKLAHFNRERIPERVVHAKGSGAYGELTVTKDISRYSSARLFSSVGKKTPIFIRFSTVGGELGSADTERVIHAALRSSSTPEDGNWDLVGNNTPVFFIRDPSKFPDFVHTQKRHPKTHTKDATMQWDFWSLHPESLHQVTILFSDRGIPDGYRYMDGFGSHTFSMINAHNERCFVKYHFKTKQGIRNLSPTRAQELAGSDPEHAQRDLFEAIERGDFPRWTMCIQIMTEAQASSHPVNPFDITKVWPHKEFPRIEIGEIVLNRNAENYFLDVEQAAFAPSSVVPGLGFSPDRMLQGRLFSYADAHRYRMGVNYHQVPVNKPRNEVYHYHRDGAGRIDANGGSAHNYHPNSFDGVTVHEGIAPPSSALSGEVHRYDHRGDEDYYSQAGDLYRLMSEPQRKLLVENIVGAMRSVPQFIQERQVGHFHKADKEYGRRVQEGLAHARRGDPLQVPVTK